MTDEVEQITIERAGGSVLVVIHCRDGMVSRRLHERLSTATATDALASFARVMGRDNNETPPRLPLSPGNPDRSRRRLERPRDATPGMAATERLGALATPVGSLSVDGIVEALLAQADVLDVLGALGRACQARGMRQLGQQLLAERLYRLGPEG